MIGWVRKIVSKHLTGVLCQVACAIRCTTENLTAEISLAIMQGVLDMDKWETHMTVLAPPHLGTVYQIVKKYTVGFAGVLGVRTP